MSFLDLSYFSFPLSVSSAVGASFSWSCVSRSRLVSFSAFFDPWSQRFFVFLPRRSFFVWFVSLLFVLRFRSALGFLLWLGLLAVVLVGRGCFLLFYEMLVVCLFFSRSVLRCCLVLVDALSLRCCVLFGVSVLTPAPASGRLLWFFGRLR